MIDHKPLNQYIHPLDIFRYILRCRKDDQKTALCVVTGTEGGGVRAAGAILAVNENGDMAGYLSNGCVDADLIIQAQNALQTDEVLQIRYGAGSPFKDIRLPCGGGVDVLIIAAPDMDVIASAVNALERREAVTLCVTRSGDMTLLNELKPAQWAEDDFYLPLLPNLLLHIAGQGAEVTALSDIARAAQCDVMIETADAICLDYAKQHNLRHHKLDTPQAINKDMIDDPYTAFVLLFHDHDWEGPLLKRALGGEAFYIGAMGSRATHIQRCKRLTDMGVSPRDIAKIRAPIGLIPASRNAYILAVSIMAEIIEVSSREFTVKRFAT